VAQILSRRALTVRTAEQRRWSPLDAIRIPTAAHGNAQDRFAVAGWTVSISAAAEGLERPDIAKFAVVRIFSGEPHSR